MLLGGWLSDRLGRKPVMIGGICAAAGAGAALFHGDGAVAHRLPRCVLARR